VNESRELEQSLQDFVEEMIGHLQWSLSVQVSAPDAETLVVELSGEDGELLLVDRAELLEVFQYLLNRIFGREADERRIVVDCDGYRARKEKELKEIAHRVSERVRRTGTAEELGLMNPYERRIVHLAVAETEGVTTESEGEGVMKRVVIFPA
jgi:spoIIIJ-associated protein